VATPARLTVGDWLSQWIEIARGDISLSYFEFGTLAAFAVMARSGLDFAVLEVGLGGRLDAVNIIDPDVAIVTTIAIDHVDYLGATREAIGREKAGIFREGLVAICADRDPPRTLLDHAAAIGAILLCLGVDYDFTVSGPQWSYRGPGGARHGLPHPALRGAYQLTNAATALTAIDALRSRLPIAMGAVREALVEVELAAGSRYCLDVPCACSTLHNNTQARALAAGLGTMGFHPETRRVRHHGGQGYRRRDCCAVAANRRLAGRDASAAARSNCDDAARATRGRRGRVGGDPRIPRPGDSVPRGPRQQRGS
jgi:dihydrofolate synthase/folylpolyglutamate synthase